ncbi:ATP-binding cassette domain-containing protein [Thermus antranikianii]
MRIPGQFFGTPLGGVAAFGSWPCLAGTRVVGAPGRVGRCKRGPHGGGAGGGVGTGLFARGKTLLFTTHYLDEAERWAERIAVLHRGRVQVDSPVRQVKLKVAAKVIRFRSALGPEPFRTLPGVLQATGVEDRVELATEEPEAVLPQVLAMDPHLSDLEAREPALEEVFDELIREREQWL